MKKLNFPFILAVIVFAVTSWTLTHKIIEGLAFTFDTTTEILLWVVSLVLIILNLMNGSSFKKRN